MGISNIQSGYRTTSLVNQNTQELSKSGAIAPEILSRQNANGSGAKEVNAAHQQAVFTQPLFSSEANGVLLSQQETKQSRLRGIANRYDVTNLSGNERVAMAQDLRDRDLISAGTQLALSAPLSIDENVGARTNYLDTARDAFEFSSKHGASLDQLTAQKDRLDILLQLHTLRT